ncbi:MAG TPA: flagellar basal body rod protein FlgC [Geminicoccaceae bacterium]|nr:flagellar basal body rod protein FlgC [Geminicoccaceae bacterium]
MPDPFFSAMGVAASGMRAQGTRIRVVAENVANADTPGFHRKQVTFEEAAHDAARHVQVDRVLEDQSALERVHDPSHPLADESGYVELSNVNPLIELADLQEAQRSYQASMSAFDQARALYQRTLDLLRR